MSEPRRDRRSTGGRPRVVVLGTGGTIASSADSATQLHDYRVTAGVEDMFTAIPELHALADLRAVNLLQLDSHAIDSAALLTIARRVAKELADPEVDGLIVTHGTDTLEETAYFLNLVLKSTKPVVVVGAMRPASALSADGPLNLYNAVRVALAPAAHGKGVLVVMNDRLFAARDVAKAHTTAVEAFEAAEEGCLGRIACGGIHLFHAPLRLHTAATSFSLDRLAELPMADIIFDHQGAGIHHYHAAIDAGARGIVLAATGNGSLSPSARLGAELAARAGVAFVRSSRVGRGIVTPSFDDETLGMIAAGSLNPQKARILLMLALTQSHELHHLRSCFERY